MLNEIRSKFFKKVSQTIMFLPYFISAVLIGAIAFNILNYDTGALNALLRETGADPIQIYSKAGLWPFIIIFCNMWQQTGYGSVVYFAAKYSLQGTTQGNGLTGGVPPVRFSM